MKPVYYESKYDKRKGGDYIRIYDENVNFIKSVKVNIDSFGKIFADGKEIDLIEIAEKGNILCGLCYTEPLNDDYVIVKGNKDLIPDPNVDTFKRFK